MIEHRTGSDPEYKTVINVKRKIAAVALLSLLVAGTVQASGINGDFNGNPIVKLKYNGQVLPIEDTPAIVFEGRTMVPIYMLKQLGVDVTWDQETYSVDVKMPNHSSQNETKHSDIKSFLSDVYTSAVQSGINLQKVDYTIDQNGLSSLNINYEPSSNGTADDKMATIATLLTMPSFYEEKIDQSVVYLIINNSINSSVTAKYDDINAYYNKKITLEQFITKWNIYSPQSSSSAQSSTSNGPVAKSTELYLYSNDGKTYLGKLTSNKYDSESIYNEFGDYGSKFSSKSIFNEFSDYGSSVSDKSAFNKFASKPPMIISGGKIVGYLTTNSSIDGAISPVGLKEWLEKNGY